MLNRRQLRIKVMQALYGFFQSGEDSIQSAENKLFHSIDRIYDLYLLQFALLSEIHKESLKDREIGKEKFFPTEEEKMETTPFTENPFFKLIEESEELQKSLERKKLSWANNEEAATIVFKKLKSSSAYKEYINTKETTFDKDIDFIIRFYKKFICDEELLISFYEEQNIYWNDDIDLVNYLFIKTLKDLRQNKPLQLKTLYKDQADDMDFIKTLFRKTIIRNEELESYITDNTKNWEAERIALMDLILMKMAICELLEFPSIPVKVSLNEYIEISKSFSTPKSSNFINGILDKVVLVLKNKNLLKKSGRGLVDNSNK
jgi:N utilization substance protein B